MIQSRMYKVTLEGLRVNGIRTDTDYLVYVDNVSEHIKLNMALVEEGNLIGWNISRYQPSGLVLDTDLSDETDIYCPCGNNPSSDGLYAVVLIDGKWVEIETPEGVTLPGGWDAWERHYQCARCAQVHRDISTVV